jgi:hypothetical protein
LGIKEVKKMTDEEMAKEYAKPWEASLAYVSVKEAYLAGLKAGEAKAKKEIEAELLKCYQGYPEEN